MLQADVNSISKPSTDKLFSIYTDYIPEFPQKNPADNRPPIFSPFESISIP
jgi:hypothetical protein